MSTRFVTSSSRPAAVLEAVEGVAAIPLLEVDGVAGFGQRRAEALAHQADAPLHDRLPADQPGVRSLDLCRPAGGRHRRPGRPARPHRPDSDAHIAVLLHTGINISPLPVRMDEWEHPGDDANPQLLKNMAREGVRL